MSVLSINLFFNTLVFWLIAKNYIIPRLNSVESKKILVPILLLHSTRHLGLMFLYPGATMDGIPSEFVYPAAYGDFLACILALLTIPLVVKNAKWKIPMLWTFNLEGSIDIVVAIALATYYDAGRYMGAAYWIPSLWVPALLVSHFLVFKLLIQKEHVPVPV